jgi:hypothetical protein
VRYTQAVCAQCFADVPRLLLLELGMKSVKDRLTMPGRSEAIRRLVELGLKKGK